MKLGQTEDARFGQQGGNCHNVTIEKKQSSGSFHEVYIPIPYVLVAKELRGVTTQRN